MHDGHKGTREYKASLPAAPIVAQGGAKQILSEANRCPITEVDQSAAEGFQIQTGISPDVESIETYGRQIGDLQTKRGLTAPREVPQAASGY